MDLLKRIWNWLIDLDEENRHAGWRKELIIWISDSIRSLILILLPLLAIIYLIIVNPRIGIWVILVILFIIAKSFFHQKRRSEHLKRKYDELLTSVQRRKSKEYLKNNIKIISSKIQPDELENNRTYYLYVMIKNTGEETIYCLDLELKLYDKYGHWLEKTVLTVPEDITPREDREFKMAILQEKYPYPKMSQFKELKIEPLVCSIFKSDSSVTNASSTSLVEICEILADYNPDNPKK